MTYSSDVRLLFPHAQAVRRAQIKAQICQQLSFFLTAVNLVYHLHSLYIFSTTYSRLSS